MNNEKSNVAQLHEAIGPRRPHQQGRNPQIVKRRIRRAIMLIAVFAVGLVFLGIQLFTTNAQIRSMNHSIDREQTTLQKRQREHRKLQKRDQRLQNQDYVKALAHSKYDYGKKGETNYHFVKK
ncbi:FtsB family cell division protein [Fructilactobacillus cliffordii]|uniref:Septum formation initiator family protein n=1 Tax=Fructilactobacillus cliffordii TaxID=2940299 RepID=A0A9Q8ZSX6_9LACO|nr:septum formation initiator family protein [Fructilactobacillus cliffordii]USS87034.1 septum formation initiator family protein [Fructilactobacillus cliffordii]USS88758.1 septum formation initiator family protein [Fructilactobacillus cliffordii]